VDRYDSQDAKMDALLRRVDWAEKPGIIYVTTRKDVEVLTAALLEKNVKALGYHGGMKASEREGIQDKFMGDGAEVIVATNAFGMGVDKSNVRFVYHYGITDSLDSYYQEIGRAGRDGDKAEAVLFFREEDMGIRRFLAGEGKLAPEQIEQVADFIGDQEGPVTPDEVADKVDLSERKLAQAIHRLEDVGALDVLPTGEVQLSGDIEVHEAAVDASLEHERHKEMKRRRLQQMHEYATGTRCRREQLLQYFGDEFNGPCNNCDNCERSATRETTDIQVDPSVGTRREVA
jgi:ATP-dependent DNA helicase RecQ